MKKTVIILLAASVLAVAGCKKFNTDTPIVPVNGISLDYEDIVILKGNSETLTATIQPSNATYKSVTWTSSNPSCATVDGGRVVGVVRGSSNITAMSTDPNIKAVCKVTVVDEIVPVTSISIEPATIILKKDAESHAYARFTPNGTTQRRIEWSVENTSIATVDANGNVKGVSNGETTLWATSKDNPEVKASATIMVVKPFETITVTNPADPDTPTDLGYEETLRIRYTFTPEDSRDVVKYTIVQGSTSKIEVSSNGEVKAKGYSSETCKIRVSSVADPTVYTDVSFKTYDAPSGIEAWNKGFAERKTMYIGKGCSQTLTLRIKNSSQVKPGTKIGMWGPESSNLSATLNDDGTEMTVRASSFASTSTSSTKVTGSIKLAVSYYYFNVNFYISEYDPFCAKIGDIIYYSPSGYKLNTADSGYRGGGIFESPVNSVPSYNTTKLGIIAYLGGDHLSEDPFTSGAAGSASYSLPGLDEGNLHGIAIPYNADFICRKTKPGGDFSNSCWGTIPDQSTGGEIFSKDHDHIINHSSPAITGFSVGNLRWSSTNSSKRRAFHNTIGLLYYNIDRGDSHRIHQVLYVSSYQALDAFTDDTGNSVYSVSNQYYYGRASSNNNINASGYLAGAATEKRVTPWLLPTVADLKTVFAGSPTAADNNATVGKTVVERASVFAKSVRVFSGNNNAIFRELTYWTSQEYSDYDAMALTIYSDGKLTAANWDKNEAHRCLPIFYF